MDTSTAAGKRELRFGTRIRVCLLGPVRVVDAERGELEVPSASQRRLLAVLAVHPGTTLRAAYLHDLLGVSGGALRNTVSRLRRLVGDDVVCSDPFGYRLEADTDAAMFTELLNGSAAGSRRLDHLDRALQLWRGGAIDEFCDEEWAMAEIARLDELHAVAVEDRARELIARDRFGEAIAALDAHVHEHPLRDAAWGLLMATLARDGRQADALRRFHDYRRYLVDNIGTEPSPQVCDLERRIAQQWNVVAPVGGDEPTVTNLPHFRSSFVGREADVAAVSECLGSMRIVSLTGEGGVGKTRLAVQVAARLMSRWQAVWFVDLASIRDPDDVRSTVAAVMGAPATIDPSALQAYLGDRSTLLLIDNCEHVLDAVTAFVDAVANAGRRLTVLATSREALGLDGEQVIHVRPLEPAGAAADLFCERARAAGARVQAAHRMEIETICRRLDGNPLAIELAATRVDALGLGTIRDGLDDRFTILTAGGRRNGDRHGTLRAVVDWSYQLLAAEEQHLFRQLGAFTGGFELDAVRDVLTWRGGSSGSAITLLASLVDRSMVVAEPQPHGIRYRLLDTLRAFALDELGRHGERAAAFAAHASWVAGLADTRMADWMTSDVHRRTMRLEREIDNWRQAVGHAIRFRDVELARRLSGPSSGSLVWGRPDLAPFSESLGELFDPADPHRAGIAFAAWGAAWAHMDLDEMCRAQDLLADIDPDDTAGTTAVLRSSYFVVTGDIAAATAARVRSIGDGRIPPDVRDFTLVLALYAVCSSDSRHLMLDDWIERAVEIAGCSDVPIVRLVARVAVAWALTETDPARSFEWAHAATADDTPMPSFHRNLGGTFVSRLLTRQSPALAATRLLELLPAADADPSTADTIALITGAGVMASCGHPDADDVVATLAPLLGVAYVSTVVTDLAARRHRGTMLDHAELFRKVREAIAQIANSTDQ